MGFLLGIDGGGAKTAAVLCDEDGRVLAQGKGAGSAIVGPPEDAFYATIEPILRGLSAEAGIALDRMDRVVLGLSGVDYPDEAEAQRRLIAERLGLGERLILVNDGLVALCGVSAEERVALVQHGSGVTTAYRTEIGREAIFDSLDVADVFDLRRAAVAVTARMIDGRAAPTLLMERVLAHCGVSQAGFAEWCMRSSAHRARRAALAEVVFGAWQAGDPAADELVRRAADDYAITVAAMAQRLGAGPFLAAFAGGVIQQGGARFQGLLVQCLAAVCPDARRADPVLPPELGAVVLGAHAAGLDARRVFARLCSAEPQEAAQ